MRKSRVSTALLAFFLGGVGAHRYYLGYMTQAKVQTCGFVCGCFGALIYPSAMWNYGVPVLFFVFLLLLFGGATSLWAFIDFIKILTGSLCPEDGSPYSEDSASQHCQMPNGVSLYSDNSNNTKPGWICSCGTENSYSISYCLRCRRTRSEALKTTKCPHCGANKQKNNTTCFVCGKSLREEKNVLSVKENTAPVIQEKPGVQEKLAISNKSDFSVTIKELAELYDQGLLTEEEFHQAKIKVLGKRLS